MARRGSALPILLGAFAVFLIIILVLSMAPRIPLPVGGLPWNPALQLTEEVNPPQVLYETQFYLEPGAVYRIDYDANGIAIVPTNGRLIERLNLSGIDLTVNDVIAPHMYVAKFLSSDAKIVFSKHLVLAQCASVAAWQPVTAYAFDISDDSVTARVNNTALGTVTTLTTNIGTGWNVAGFDWVGNVFMKRDGGTVTSLNPGGGLTLVPTNAITVTKDFRALAITSTGSFTITYYAYSALYHHKVKYGVLLADATFYNGTTFADIVGGAVGVPSGSIVLLPDSQQWLWYIPNLATDNMLHVKYAPPGATFVIKYDGKVYEWRITGTPNKFGLIEDFPIDIANIFGTTVLSNATVELVYPSDAVRFYVPSGFQGFQVEVEGNWSEMQTVGNTTYVDFGVPYPGTYVVKVLGYEAEPHVSVETYGDAVRVTVTDEAGYALSDAKVYVYNSNGTLLTYGVTNDLGFVDFNKSVLTQGNVKVSVVALKDGYYYHADKLVTLAAHGIETPTATFSAPEAGQALTAQGNASGVAVALVLLLLMGVTVVVLVGRGRKR